MVATVKRHFRKRKLAFVVSAVPADRIYAKRIPFYRLPEASPGSWQ